MIQPISLLAMGNQLAKDLMVATFAGGCFWCMEYPFESLEGVYDVIPGYTGGVRKKPTYEEVSSGKTGHVEAVLISYNPEKISYKTLLDVFWQQIDPTDEGGQFADRGSHYQTAIFYHSDEQKKLAQFSKDELAKSGRFKQPIVTKLLEATDFYPAEQYHHDYYKKNPVHYQSYKRLSGRAGFLKETWPDKN